LILHCIEYCSNPTIIEIHIIMNLFEFEGAS
jgi:hypothetical protein